MVAFSCVSCTATNAKKGYKAIKQDMRSRIVNYGYSSESIRFLYCDYVSFEDPKLARSYPIYNDVITYSVYTQANFTGSLTRYRDIYIYYRSDGSLKYLDSDDSYDTFALAISLVESGEVKGKVGTIKD